MTGRVDTIEFLIKAAILNEIGGGSVLRYRSEVARLGDPIAFHGCAYEAHSARSSGNIQLVEELRAPPSDLCLPERLNHRRIRRAR